MQINVEVKNEWGNIRVYPTNNVKDLQAITGTKTISKSQIKALQNMGCTFMLNEKDWATELGIEIGKGQ